MLSTATAARSEGDAFHPAGTSLAFTDDEETTEPAPAPLPDGDVIPRTSVYVGNVSPGQVGTPLTRALLGMFEADKDNGWNLWKGTVWAKSGAQISKSRNDVAREFLDNYPDGEWLLWLDSDMVPPPDIIPRLLLAAQKTGAKIMGALCVMVNDMGPIPTLYQFETMPGSDALTRVNFDWPENTIIQVAATGGACVLIHRDVLTAMRESVGHDWAWYNEGVFQSATGANHWVSEDIAFCLRAGELGYSTWVDCTTHVGHHKGGRTWTPKDVKTGFGVPPSPITAVIPMRDRWELTAALVDQLLTQGDATDVLIMDNGSEDPASREWLNAQGRVEPDGGTVHVFDCAGMGIHEMWNRGVQWSFDKHGVRVRVALLNNDLKVGPRFLRNLSRAMDDDRTLSAVSANYDGRVDSTGTGLVYVEDICANRYDGTGGLAGFAFMLRGEIISGGYRFPTDCKWWFGDNDLMRHLALARRRSTTGGFNAAIVVDATVEHEGGATAGDKAWSDPKWADALAADQAAHEKKWAMIMQAEADEKAVSAGDLMPLLTRASQVPSDIYEHLPTLFDTVMAGSYQWIVELGVRGGVSSLAFLSAVHRTGGRLIAVDVDPAPRFVTEHPRCRFVQADDRDREVLEIIGAEFGDAEDPDRPVDVLFVDTDHRYLLTKEEIALYVPLVRDGGVVIFHDTAVETFDHHEPGTEPPFPVRKAVDEWLAVAGWAALRWENCNGLTVVSVGIPGETTVVGDGNMVTTG